MNDKSQENASWTADKVVQVQIIFIIYENHSEKIQYFPLIERKFSHTIHIFSIFKTLKSMTNFNLYLIESNLFGGSLRLS